MEKYIYIGSYQPDTNEISSNKFEDALIHGFHDKYKDDATFISVINKPINFKKQVFKVKLNKKIELTTISSGGFILKRMIKQMFMVTMILKRWCKENGDYDKVIFMINSMPNISIPTYLMKLLFKCKIISFTIDTPIPYLKTKKGLDYYFSKFYYALSFKMIHRLNGIILLNKRAYKELKLNIPCFIAKIGFNPQDYQDEHYIIRESNNKKIITYAGTLIDYNGIDNLLSAFDYINDENIILNIYGDGPSKEKVLSMTSQKSNVFYYGLIGNKKMMKVLSQSDIVINPRISSDEVCNFTFPSKLIEYMLSGAAVLTTKINSIPEEYYDFLYFIEDENPEGIANSIFELLKIPQTEIERKYIMGKEFLYNNQTWEKVIDDIDFFIKSI